MSTSTFTFKGKEFTIVFSEVVRIDTTRSTGTSETREDVPAYRWTGKVSVEYIPAREKIEAEFTTEIFFTEHVEGLSCEQILQLILNGGHLYKVNGPVLDEEQRICDLLGQQITLGYTYGGCKSLCISPLRWEDLYPQSFGPGRLSKIYT